MFKALALLAVIVAPYFANAAVQTRCGWIQNPTPANWWLNDRDGEWIIGVQGGYQANGIDLIEINNDDEWVETNVHYGYGCGCAEVEVEASTKRVLNVRSFTQKLLKTCLEDRALPSMTCK